MIDDDYASDSCPSGGTESAGVCYRTRQLAASVWVDGQRVEHSEVLMEVELYCGGSPVAFLASSDTMDEGDLDGVSITYGHARRHVYSQPNSEGAGDGEARARGSLTLVQQPFDPARTPLLGGLCRFGLCRLGLCRLGLCRWLITRGLIAGWLGTVWRGYFWGRHILGLEHGLQQVPDAKALLGTGLHLDQHGAIRRSRHREWPDLDLRPC